MKELSNLPEESNGFPVNRCIRLGLGIRTQWQNDVGSLERYAKTMAYKRQGTLCSLQDHKMAHRKIEKSGHSDTVRQPNCHLLHKEARRYKVSWFIKTVKTSLGHVSSGAHSHPSAVHSGTLQSDSRQSVPQETNRRVEPVPICYQENLRTMGYSRDRFVRDRIISCGTSICQPRSKRQESDFHKRVQSAVDLQPSLDISSTSINAASTAAPEQCERVIHSHSTEVGKIFLESRPLTESHSTSLPNSKSTAPSNRPGNSSSPIRYK